MTSTKSIAKTKLSFNVYVSLNKSSYKKLKPKSKPYYARDKKLEGFWIRTYPSGKQSYGCYARKGGVGRQIPNTIGDCELWEFDKAKAKAKEVIQQIRYEGINPKHVVRQEASKKKTLLHLADEYFKSNKVLKESSKVDYLSRLKNRMPKLIKMPVTEITLEDIQDWWDSSKGKRSDVVAFIYARKLMERATASRYVPENNFARAKTIIGDFPSINQKTEHIPKDEMFGFFKNFLKVSPEHGTRPIKGQQISQVMRDYLLFILITGKRRGETSSLKWSNVDFKRGTITLDKTKSNTIDVVPMTDVLFTMLDYRFRMDGKTQATSKHPMWVFQSRSGDGHIENPFKAFVRLNKQLSLADSLSSHDFRRTFATATRELGLSHEDLNVLLNHSKSRKDTTEGYVQAHVDYKRNNLEAVSEFYNKESNYALNNIMALWYEANSNFFEHDRMANEPSKKQDYGNTKLHLLGRYESDFQGYGHDQWEPSEELKKKGWTKD